MQRKQRVSPTYGGKHTDQRLSACAGHCQEEIMLRTDKMKTQHVNSKVEIKTLCEIYTRKLKVTQIRYYFTLTLFSFVFLTVCSDRMWCNMNFTSYRKLNLQPVIRRRSVAEFSIKTKTKNTNTLFCSRKSTKFRTSAPIHNSLKTLEEKQVKWEDLQREVTGSKGDIWKSIWRLWPRLIWESSTTSIR